MEWTESLKRSINFMENHLLEDISPDDVAAEVHISSFYLQKGFSIMTGYSIGEYIRYRRLYLAALDVIAGSAKVIDLAYRYGYDTPESFTKAFSRFHGVSPAQMKKTFNKIHTFLPLKITVSVQGGNDMDYAVEKMNVFSVIGYEYEVRYDDSYQTIPKLWDQFCEHSDHGDNSPEVQQAIDICKIGEFGICIDDNPGGDTFHYLIVGHYNGGPVPEGMKVFEIPAAEWAKFHCTGPLPGSLQAVNTKIFKEWLPGNPDYEFSMNMNIEWYSMSDCSQPDYESEIWIPVKRK